MGEFVEQPVYAQLARIGKALSSPVRLRLLDLLDRGEFTVERLAETAGVPVKNTSAQLQELRAAHLVTSRKEGNRIHYRLAGPEVTDFLGAYQRFAEGRLADLREAVDGLLGDPEVLEPVDAEELQARLGDSTTVIVDVRSAREYAEGHIPGAVSVPLGQLRERLGELPEGVEIVAYCQGPYCVASPQAVELLRAHGRNARPLEGGAVRWRRTGRGFETRPEALATD